MEDKVTPARLAAYAARLARRVCDAAYAGAEAVEGPTLLSLTPVRQLNLLVLHGLLHRWQQETRRLRSPYFNYDHPDVQQALTGLMNTLSRHIRVRRVDLEPLLTAAVVDAVGLVLTPAETYAARFLTDAENPEPLTAAGLRTELKYLEANKPLFEDFVNSLPATPVDRVSAASRVKLHVTANAAKQATPDDLLRQLNAVEPVTLAELTKPADVAPALKAPEPAKPAEAPKATAPVEATPATAGAPAADKAHRPSFVPLPETPATPLHAKFQAESEKVSLNDQLRSKVPDAPELAEVLAAKAKVESLTKAISINMRYTFISELFDGNRDAYEQAIQQLDAQPTADTARAYATSQLAGQYGWAGKDEHVQKLLRLIDRKFA